jgi:hypothetical protein
LLGLFNFRNKGRNMVKYHPGVYYHNQKQLYEKG